MKVLGYINLVGVGILATLCAVQWTVNRTVNLWAISLDRTRLEQVRKIEDLEAGFANCKNDLEDFRTRLTRTRDELVQTEQALSSMTAARDKAIDERDQMTAERDELQAHSAKLIRLLKSWTTAVEERDKALKKADDDILVLARQRDDTVEQFNTLAAKYNGVVKDLNEARSKQSGQ